MVLDVKDLRYHLPGNGRTLVNGISFSVGAGETVVLLGGSGSGKTTTLKLVSRLLIRTGGGVRMAGGPAGAVAAAGLRCRVSCGCAHRAWSVAIHKVCRYSGRRTSLAPARYPPVSHSWKPPESVRVLRPPCGPSVVAPGPTHRPRGDLDLHCSPHRTAAWRSGPSPSRLAPASAGPRERVPDDSQSGALRFADSGVRYRRVDGDYRARRVRALAHRPQYVCRDCRRRSGGARGGARHGDDRR